MDPLPTGNGPPSESRGPEGDGRVHLNVGATCNNNCIFCMEEDRESRYAENSAVTPEIVLRILERNRGAEEICFTSGEPTTNPELARYARWARERGFPRVAIMTNGRMLSQPRYAMKLVLAGVNRFYVSIHGDTRKLHEGLTRTPGSFANTVRGIEVIAALKRRFHLDLHTSTVITRRNLPHLAGIYRFLRDRGVDQVVFNAMQVNGRAATCFDRISARYGDIAEAFCRFLAEAAETRRGEPVMAFLVDIPRCTTAGIASFNRGFVEPHRHYKTLPEAGHLIDEQTLATRAQLAGGDGAPSVVELSGGDLDRAKRQHREACGRCRHRPSCEGVWSIYVERHGWDEFVPIA